MTEKKKTINVIPGTNPDMTSKLEIHKCGFGTLKNLGATQPR